MKICTKCTIEKDEAEFDKDKYNKTGLHSHCKSCKRAYQSNRSLQLPKLKAEIAKRHSVTIKGKFTQYKGSAKKRDIDFTLSLDEFSELWRRNCTYCNSEIETVGIDRVDNSKGYIKGNIVPCCKTCNKMKLNMTTETFIDHCQKIISVSLLPKENQNGI